MPSSRDNRLGLVAPIAKISSFRDRQTIELMIHAYFLVSLLLVMVCQGAREGESPQLNLWFLSCPLSPVFKLKSTVNEKRLSLKDFQKYPKSLRELARFVHEDLIELGMPEDLSTFFAFRAAETVRRHFGGQALYVPKANRYYIAMRNSEILKRFDGKNYSQLSRETGLTERHLYDIVNKNRKIKKNE